MKRVVSSSLISVFIIIAVAAGIIYYQKYSAKGASAFDCIPADASFIISSKHASTTIKQITRTAYWKDLNETDYFKRVTLQLLFFDSALVANQTLHEALSNHELFLSFHVTAATDFDILFLSENFTASQAKTLIQLLSDGNPTVRNYNGTDIQEVNTSFGLFSFTVIRGVFAGSFSPFLVEDAIRQQRSTNKLKDLAEAMAKKKNDDPVIIINHKKLPTWISIFLNESRKDKISRLGAFADYSAYAISILENEIDLVGTTVADTTDYLHMMTAQQSVNLSFKKVLPSKTAAFVWHGVSNWDTYLPALKNYFKANAMQSISSNHISEIEKQTHISIESQWLYWLGNEYALVVTEPASTNYDNTCYAVFKATEISKALTALGRLAEKANVASGNKQQNEEQYNGHVIRYLDLPGLLPALFGGLFNRINRFYYTDMEGYIIVANQPSALRSLINDNATGNMVANDAVFTALLNKIPSQSNFCFYSNISASTYLLRSIASQSTMEFIEQNKKTWSRCDALMYSAKTLPDRTFKTEAFFHYKSSESKGVHQLWSCALDTTISTAPQFIGDSSQVIQLLVQDNNNTVYKINNSGAIDWKKNLDSQVLSRYHLVDPHRNGQPCYLFNTRSFIYMLDASGNNCTGFPIRLPKMATNAVSLVDYYGNGDYRIFVACGNMSVYGWLLNGKSLGGWYFKKTQQAVNDSLQYFRFGNNDFLVMTDTDFNFYVLNKMGQHQQKGRLISKKPGTCFYKVFSKDSDFQLMMMDTSGAISLVQENTVTNLLTSAQTTTPLTWLPLDANADNQDDFVLLGEQELKIVSDDNLVLASHLFTEKMSAWLQPFTLMDGKTRLGVYSAQAGNIYLLEKNGSVMKGFPVNGSTSFDVINSVKDNRDYLITGSGNNVYLYGIN